MANEKFTQLPTVANSQLTDIIAAVQAGVSVQETLSQVFSNFLSNTILHNAGNPNGSVAGNTYQLCWDTTNLILYICTTSGNASTTVWNKVIKLTQGSGITISQSGNTIEISASGIGISWTVVTGTSATLVSNNGYITNNAGLVTLNLPATSSVGDVIYVMGKGSGGWKIQAGGGQTIVIGNSSSSVAGYVASTNAKDSCILICTVDSTEWQVPAAPQGILTIA